MLLSGCGEPLCGAVLDDAARRCVVEHITDRLETEYPVAFLDLKDIDLQDITEALQALPDAYDGDDDDAFLEALEREVAALHDGHTGVIRKPDDADGALFLELRRVDGRLRIARDYREELPLGAELVAVGGALLEERVAAALPQVSGSTEAARERYAIRRALRVESGWSGMVTLGGDDGAQGVRATRAGWLLPEPVSSAVLDGDIGYLRVPSFSEFDTLDQIDAALEPLLDTRGLVIDLRGNAGGHSITLNGLLGRLFEERPPDYLLLNPDGSPSPLHDRVNPRGEIHDGPVAVLVDAGSGSAANVMAHRIALHGHGFVCGEPTGGGAGVIKEGVVLILEPRVRYAQPFRYLAGPDGEDVELGVAPDPACAVVYTEADLRAGALADPGNPATDLALQRAMAVLE